MRGVGIGRSSTDAGHQRRRKAACRVSLATLALAGLVAWLGPRAGAAEPVTTSVPAGVRAVPSVAGPIALLPFESLGNGGAPLADIRAALRRALEARGIPLLDDAVLEEFMRRHRLRYTGGLAAESGRALAEETGAGGVLVTSVDLYNGAPPMIALTARLIEAGGGTRILWMDGAGQSGDEAPGFLGLGRIDDPIVLRDQVLARLAGSLAARMTDPDRRSGEGTGERIRRRFTPSIAFHAPRRDQDLHRTPRIAVLPLANETAMRHADEIVTLQILRYLAATDRVEVIEPGLVREALLRSRLIQDEGLSVPQADLLRALLGVDIALFGEVTQYLETGSGVPEPEIGFSVRAIDTATRQVVWSSISHRRGEDGVVFFGLGRVPTARRLSARLAQALVGTILASLEDVS